MMMLMILSTFCWRFHLLHIYFKDETFKPQRTHLICLKHDWRPRHPTIMLTSCYMMVSSFLWLSRRPHLDILR